MERKQISNYWSKYSRYVSHTKMICLKSQLNLKYTRLHTSTSICTYIYVSWFHGQIADADRVIVFSLASQWHTRNYASGNATSIRSLYDVNPASTAIESKKRRYCFLRCSCTPLKRVPRCLFVGKDGRSLSIQTSPRPVGFRSLGLPQIEYELVEDLEVDPWHLLCLSALVSARSPLWPRAVELVRDFKLGWRC
jgi:hypothetical protein